jgi:hypothetical protein
MSFQVTVIRTLFIQGKKYGKGQANGLEEIRTPDLRHVKATS